MYIYKGKGIVTAAIYVNKRKNISCLSPTAWFTDCSLYMSMSGAGLDCNNVHAWDKYEGRKNIYIHMQQRLEKQQ